MHQETRLDDLVRFQLVHVGRLHCLAGGSVFSAAGAFSVGAGILSAGAAMSGETSLGGAFRVVPGIGMKSNFLWRFTRAATSSLVVVCGFNCATSRQRVSLPAAAPL